MTLTLSIGQSTSKPLLSRVSRANQSPVSLSPDFLTGCTCENPKKSDHIPSIAPLKISKAFEKVDLNLLRSLFMKSINGNTHTSTANTEAPINHDKQHHFTIIIEQLTRKSH